ncbi:neurofilament heavy polypeptide isoform X2 [Drosophila eugracilis]|uniref:neurofilament heavy polypeptide isoform X2 n=1 Tax=Drosophila eugracilis TaxID=29029 RepID=UPI001BDABB4D|nr:neurofilament heavy polypeptide isoform X2 [Drosophila eugracilis]
MFPGAFENNNCFEKNVNNRRCCYCVTHEMGVQTDEFECEVKTDQESSGDDESQRDSSASEVFVTEVITKEAEVTHRTGQKETIIEKYESVAHIPNIEDPARKKQPKEKNQEDNALREEPKMAETPARLMRISELYPIVESFMAEVPVSGSQSGTEEMIYNQYQTYERHADEPEGKATVEELVEQPKSKADSPISSISKMRTPKPRLSKSRSPISSSPKPPKPVSSPKSGNDSPKEVSESPKPVSSPKSGNDSPKEVSEPAKPVSSPKSGKDFSSPEVSEPNSKENVSVKEKEEKDDNVSNPTTEEENEEEMEEEKPTIARSKIPSDVSTVHVRVTNRRVARKKRPNARESPTNVTGIFESRVSQLLLKKKREKPEAKKPKIRAPPKLEVKTGYPPNDLVCRFANPPKCRPACNIIQCPCSGPNFCDPCCSCPSSTRQCDPIYGFGSQCIGYYCH